MVTGIVIGIVLPHLMKYPDTIKCFNDSLTATFIKVIMPDTLVVGKVYA